MGWELAGVVDELDELPEVGPATGETIIEYRRTDGMFRSVTERTSMRNRKTPEIGFHAVVLGNGTRSLQLARAWQRGGKARASMSEPRSQATNQHVCSRNSVVRYGRRIASQRQKTLSCASAPSLPRVVPSG
jgi:hypothetical protein